MQFLSLLAIAGAATAQGVSKGFNYGNVFTDGSPKQQADFEAEFNRAHDLPNTSGFSSARLYTMIQGGTTNTPISAIQAAIDTQTSLLLGLWASSSSDVFQNELDALSSAISQYGSALTDLIVGISVGSEDLYRSSAQGIENESGIGEGPAVLVDYIQRTRSVIAGTAASAATVGHVDTWNDWVNVSNTAVIDAVDWIGFNGFPYFENTLDNNIANGNSLFFSALNRVEGVSQDKPVWITEAGWPVSGSTENQAVASIENSKTYWDEVGCELFNKYNTFWYILRDDNSSPAPSPSFGIVGRDLEEPLFDLTCPAGSSGASTAAAPATANGTAIANGTLVANHTLVANGSLIANVAMAAILSAANKNVTANLETSLPMPINITESTPPPSYAPHRSTASIFNGDMPAILKALPAIVAADPSVIEKLPAILAANPDLIKQVDGLDFTKMAAEYNVAPVYVDILKNAIKKVQQGGLERPANGADTIADLLREGGGA
jgi:glucan endo-1,3-beta-D-glucosidase